MNTKYENLPAMDGNIVYIRRVERDQLPAEVTSQLADLDSVYALHGVDGERLALVTDRRTAFALAAQNELTAVSVH
ncbi:MAG: DUF1150 family protein [Paracoccus sp. (in: a-proteobacteria)]|nr:DUF1150 family protein [Paracoccus sp. (in: a-proteobacteria)]